MRLTPFSRLLIVAAVIAGLFFGVRKLIPSLGVGAAKTTTETPADSGNGSYSGNETGGATAPTVPSTPASGGGGASTGAASAAFSFVAPEPVNGVLKGVVEVGASGFNSFVVRVDNQKHWKLEKSEFGNSLVTENMASSDDIKMGLKKRG